jgi:hypothetical protein
VATNELAPKVTGINRLVDFVAQKIPPKWFGTSGRTFLETVQGSREPITEQNYTPAELDAIRELIQVSENPGQVQYGDYRRLGKQMQSRGELPVSLSPSLFSMGDSLGTAQTTLGRFKYSRDNQGNLIVIDTYDFNTPMVPGSTQEARTGDYGVLGPYGLIRDYAGEKIPPGYGRDVRINLGNKK